MLLASSAACPVHMFRIKSNLYATQFHPELDAEGLVELPPCGYFRRNSAEMLMDDARQSASLRQEPMKILRNFVERYASEPLQRNPGVFNEHAGLLPSGMGTGRQATLLV